MRTFLLPILFFSQVLSAQWMPTDTIRFLALGDSYTIGQNVPVAERWPVQLMDSLVSRGYVNDTLNIIATTGWRTDQLISAVSGQGLKDRNYTMCSMLIGVNDQYQNRPFAMYRPHFRQIIDSALSYVENDTDKVFVLSIPDYAFTPFGQQGNPFIISQQLDAYNQVNKEVCDSLGITYFNITPISRNGLMDPTLVANDQLHPSGFQYSLWVEEILGYVDSIDVFNSASVGEIPDFDRIDLSYVNGGWQICSGLISIEGYEYELIDMRGNSLLKGVLNEKCTDISSKGIDKGTYLIAVKQNGQAIWKEKVLLRL